MKVLASSFADPADVRAFVKCKERGGSDEQCLKVGDNGIGCFGDQTAQTHTPMCALPPEDISAKFGSVKKGKRARVQVSANGRAVICTLADRMPAKKNIKNGAGIDLNPAAAAALKLKPPFLVPAEWDWC